MPDLSLQEFYYSYKELTDVVRSNGFAKTLQDILKLCLSNDAWNTMSIALARVIAAKPHSCDVERLVSAYNLIKDDDRTSLNAETVDAYLHVHVNMPVLAEFDVRPALHYWVKKVDHHKRKSQKATEQAWFVGVFREAKKT